MSTTSTLYAGLAGYYDRFCAGVDYAEQGRFALRAFRAFAGSGGMDYLDLACGTGQLLQAMAGHGFVPHGLDNSAAMLTQAATRCPTATLQQCDMAELCDAGRYDLITCLLYSLHYSHPTARLQQTLARCFAALKPGGVLVFNAVDARGIQNDDGVTTYVTEADHTLSFQSGWHYRGEGDVLDLHLSITRKAGDASERWHDHHTMTALQFPQLQAMLHAIGFELDMLEHDYGAMLAWQGESSNAIFVARKPDAAAV